MPTEYWYPKTAATHNLPSGFDAWALGAGANKNAAACPGGGRSGPMTNDDDTSYISSGLSNAKQALNPDWPGPIAAVGATFSYYMRDACAVGGGARNAGFVNAAGTEGSPCVVVAGAAGYIDHSGTALPASTYRPGGGSWDPSDFVDDQTIFLTALHGTHTDAVKVTGIWGQLDYSPPSGGFAFLLNLAGLGALPFVGALTDLAHFHRYLAWRRVYHRRHTIMRDDEVRRAWREIRAYRHPRFFFPAVA